jgi:hypothetical protein
MFTQQKINYTPLVVYEILTTQKNTIFAFHAHYGHLRNYKLPLDR